MFLFKCCLLCLSKCSKTVMVKGTMVVVRTVCSRGHRFIWHSQCLSKNKTGVGNLLLAASILYSGSSATKILRLLKFIGISVFDISTYFRFQRNILFPVIRQSWTLEQTSLFQEYGSAGITLCGDGRCDSPGFSAKYGAYSFVEPYRRKILHFELVQSNEVNSSVHMEKEGLQRGLKFLREHGIVIECLITDRHVQVRSLLKKEYPEIKHRFDCWHLAKGIKKQIVSAAKCKGSEILLEWCKSIVNHLYWCAASSAGEQELVVEKWKSLLEHICNVHSWQGTLFSQCLHEPYGPLERRKWLEQDTDAFNKLSRIVIKNVNDVRHLSTGEQTSCVENFHSVIIGFAPKSQNFSFEGMLARIHLAALHFNENGNKAQSKTKDQELRFSVVYPKAKKGAHTVRTIKEKSTYGYVEKLLTLTVDAMSNKEQLSECSQGISIVVPPPLASQYTHPDKHEAVATHVTRFHRTA